MTLHQAILHGEEILDHNDISDARWNSERILALAIQKPRSQIYAELNRPLSTQELSDFEKLLKKRAAHYPFAYLEGTQEFFGREFFVSEDVLIPRPETELIVQEVQSFALSEGSRILDLGSGSGCIAVTLAMEVKNSFVIALEFSHQAIPVLQKNARSRVHIVRGDFHSLGFRPFSFDVITANLPYVEREEYDLLPAETKWEPRKALLVESLENSYQKVMHQSVLLLKPGGHLVMEFGFGQLERLRTVAETVPGLEIAAVRNDHQKIPRVISLRSLL